MFRIFETRARLICCIETPPTASLALRKIGIYGGTFDPIHHGHLILARQAREELGLEAIIFVPAAVSPFKNRPAASGEARLAMLKAAVAGEDGFLVDEFEMRRPPPSFTIDTVEYFREREPTSEIYYLIGQDNVGGLSGWRRFNDLQKLVRFVVLDRTGDATSHSHLTVRRTLDISATDIRKRVASHQSIRYFVPETVAAIIERESLYQGDVK